MSVDDLSVFRAIELPNYLNARRCEDLISRGSVLDTHKGDHPFWSERIRWPGDIFDADLAGRLDSVRHHVAGNWPVCVRDVENWQLVHWPIGFKMPLHDDYGGHGEFPDREFAAIIYLNDGYLGGHTFFENGCEIKPEIGKLVVFRGGLARHGVTEILGKDRWTLITWLSLDR